MHHHHGVGVLHAGDGGVGDDGQRRLEVTLGLILLGAVGDAADHGAQLVDDLRMPGTEGDMGLPVVRLQRQRLLQAALDLVTYADGECLGDRDHLAVATQRQGVEVPGVDVVWLTFLQLLGVAGGQLERLALGILVIQQVAGVDHQRLVRHVEAILAGGQPQADGPGEITGVIGAPGFLYLFIFGPGLGIPLVQPLPVLLKALPGIVIGGFRPGEGGEIEVGLCSGHMILPVKNTIKKHGSVNPPRWRDDNGWQWHRARRGHRLAAWGPPAPSPEQRRGRCRHRRADAAPADKRSRRSPPVRC